MSHLTSSSALHTARVILHEFNLTVKPSDTLVSGRVANLTNSEGHVATVIDYATNVFQIAILRPELRYWQKRLKTDTAEAPQIQNFVSKFLTAFEMLPKDSVDEVNKFVSTFHVPKEFGNKPRVQALSKPSRKVAQFLYHYYFVAPKNGVPDEKLDWHQVARLAEVSLGLTRACAAVPILVNIKSKLTAGTATISDVKKAFRQVGIFLTYLPMYENSQEEVKLLV